MNHPDPQDDDLNLPDQLPPAVLQALRAFDGPTPLPDARRREQVLDGAREHFASVRRQHQRRLFFRLGAAGSALAAAAAIAVVVYIGGPMDLQSEPAASPLAQAEAQADEPAIAGDANRDGSVDAGDLLNLGRALSRGEQPAGADLNNDGIFDQRDIDSVAAIAVDLNLERGIELTTLAPSPRGFFTFAADVQRNDDTNLHGGVR